MANNVCEKCGNIIADSNDVAEKAIALEDKSEHNDNLVIFSSIGAKIKNLALITIAIGTVIGVDIATDIAVIDEKLVLTGILAGSSVTLISILCGFLLFGFGDLIQCQQRSAHYLKEILKEVKSSK